MARSNSLYLAAAPVLLLFLLCIGARIASRFNGEDAPGQSSTPPVFVSAPTQRELETAVSGQMTALRQGDYQKALQFAAPSFRQTLTAVRFRNIILADYAPLASSARTDFTLAQGGDDAATLPTTAIAPDGATASYLYLLVKTPEGWRITGCLPSQPTPPVPTVTSVRQL